MKIPLKIRLSVISALLLLLCWASAQAEQGYGSVSFANSGSAAAQSDFLRGLAQLHNFEYGPAAEHFRKAEQLSPDFAMAYWGEAMTQNHAVWHEQDMPAARAVLTRLGATPEARQAKAPTQREKLYLHSIEILYGDGTKEERDQKYELAMADLHRGFPDDVDAASFYALAILGCADQGRDFTTYMRAAAVLEEIFPQNPRHPGVVHYLIHCYDDPIHAPLGLRAARIYSKIAPDAGHAQHMTSHIFLALGMWDDVVEANETATAVVNRQRQTAGKPPRMCGHYNYWLEYGYLQQGRTADARRVLEGCRQEAERDAARAAARKGEADPDTTSVDSYSEMRASFLIDTQLWNDDVVHWTLPAGEYEFAQFTFDYANALADIQRGDNAAAREAVARVESDRQRCEAWLDQRKLQEPQDRKRVLMLTGQLQALLLLKSGKGDDAVRELQRLAADEQEMPLQFGPPFIDKPTNELLGEALSQLNRPSEAQAAFQDSLARAPGRRLSTAELARAHKQVADTTAKKDANRPNAPTVEVHDH
jgi:tetratricopeptide (TPR) repeat protein